MDASARRMVRMMALNRLIRTGGRGDRHGPRRQVKEAEERTRTSTHKQTQPTRLTCPRTARDHTLTYTPYRLNSYGADRFALGAAVRANGGVERRREGRRGDARGSEDRTKGGEEASAPHLTNAHYTNDTWPMQRCRHPSNRGAKGGGSISRGSCRSRLEAFL